MPLLLAVTPLSVRFPFVLVGVVLSCIFSRVELLIFDPMALLLDLWYVSIENFGFALSDLSQDRSYPGDIVSVF